MFIINEQELVTEFFTRMAVVTNQLKTCGETVSGVMKVEKVLKTLTPSFDYIVFRCRLLNEICVTCKCLNEIVPRLLGYAWSLRYRDDN